jgi:hypothetical protein
VASEGRRLLSATAPEATGQEVVIESVS